MTAATTTKWHIAGEECGSCNCAWGCPCQFNALPTHGRCEGINAFQIQDGHFGNTRLAGVRFAGIYWWPGPVHEGNGTRQLIIDEQATPDQRAAVQALVSGGAGGAFFEIFAAVCPNVIATIVAPITVQSDRARRQATLRIPGIIEGHIEPIKNPVTGEEHHARIVLPNGFEYKEAEICNTTHVRVQSTAPLIYEHTNTYAQLNAFDWSNG